MSTIRKPSNTSARPAAPSQRVSHGLVALSSAVVMAVYSAGYLRTQAAADRFAAETGQRRPVVPAPAPEVAGASEELAPAVNEARPAPSAAAPVTPTTPAPVPVATRAASAAPSTAAPVAAPKPSGTPDGPATSAAAAAIAVAPVAAEATTVATAAAPSPAAPTSASAATENATPAKLRYKDGTYTGWGTSRHGDIEAQVIIVNGRITSATIAQCWTRWPCSWIEALPGQVVARQSPETDFVSGATQSTNAFYYAVVQALGKAALP